MTEPDLSELEALSELGEARKQIADLSRRLRKLKAKDEELVEATLEGARAAFLAQGKIPPVPKPKPDTRKHKPEVALWHLTDWQGSKVTATYNSDVMAERIFRFCDKAERFTNIQRADHPVRKCVMMLGGDIIEGLFNYPTQPYEVDMTLFEQFAFAAQLLVKVTRRALSTYEAVEVVTEWGNHGRVGHKRDVVPASDNLDRMIYFVAGWVLRESPDASRIVWRDCPDGIQRVEIGNYRALLCHGDEIGKYGNAAPMTVVKHVANWKSGAYPWAFKDCYMGHKHRHMDLDLPDGSGMVYMTGAPESSNTFAMEGLASSAMPSQRLHFIEPSKGIVAAQYKVHLA